MQTAIVTVALLAALAHAQSSSSCGLGNPCYTGWGGSSQACPSQCPQVKIDKVAFCVNTALSTLLQVSAEYGECCVNNACGSKDECESTDTVSGIMGMLFCCCCYGGIGFGLYLCGRHAAQHNQPQPQMGVAQPQMVVQGTVPGQPIAQVYAVGGNASGLAPGSIYNPTPPPPQYAATASEWKETQDPSSGRTYWYTDDGQTTWENPNNSTAKP